METYARAKKPPTRSRHVGLFTRSVLLTLAPRCRTRWKRRGSAQRSQGMVSKLSGWDGGQGWAEALLSLSSLSPSSQ